MPRCPAGVFHADFDFDRTKAERCRERLLESEAETFRASPDLMYMLVPTSDLTAWAVGKAMVCDHSLPPNSLVAASPGPEGRIVVAASQAT